MCNIYARTRLAHPSRARQRQRRRRRRRKDVRITSKYLKISSRFGWSRDLSPHKNGAGILAAYTMANGARTEINVCVLSLLHFFSLSLSLTQPLSLSVCLAWRDSRGIPKPRVCTREYATYVRSLQPPSSTKRIPCDKSYGPNANNCLIDFDVEKTPQPFFY